jgi:glutamyl-tRNA synthetase
VLSEIVVNVDFLFLDAPPADEAAWQKAMKEGAADLLAASAAAFGSLPEWTAEALKAALEEVGTARGLKLGKAQAPVRVAVTGRTVGLPLFESLEVLGRERTIARIRAAEARLHTA